MKQYADMIPAAIPVFEGIMQLKHDELAINLPTEYGTTIRTLIQTMINEWDQGGHAQQDIDEASYAIISFVDESIMLSAWSGKEKWAASLLQVEYFQEHLAGVEFYEKAHKLMHASPRAVCVLAVYQACIYLGFKGKYLFDDPQAFSVFQQGLSDSLIHDLGIAGAISLC